MPTKKLRKGKALEILGPPVLYWHGKIGMTLTDSSRAFGMDYHTLKAHMEKNPELREAFERGKAEGDEALRLLQWKKARARGAGSVAMVIHMSKHRLGEHDRALHEHELKPNDAIAEIMKLIDGSSRGLPDPAKIPGDDAIDITPKELATGVAIKKDGEPIDAREFFDLPDPSKVPDER